MPPLFYFARHGESEANLSRTFSNRSLPHHLTAAGRMEAESFARQQSDAGLTFIWSSPVPRAVETAGIVSAALSVPSEIADALREFDVGSYEGTSSANGWHEYDAVLQAWLAGEDDRRVGGGESLTEIHSRFVPFIERLVSEANENARVLLISHGGLYRVSLSAVLMGITRQFAIDNTLGHTDMVVAEVRWGQLHPTSWCGVLIQ